MLIIGSYPYCGLQKHLEQTGITTESPPTGRTRQDKSRRKHFYRYRLSKMVDLSAKRICIGLLAGLVEMSSTQARENLMPSRSLQL